MTYSTVLHVSLWMSLVFLGDSHQHFLQCCYRQLSCCILICSYKSCHWGQYNLPARNLVLIRWTKPFCIHLLYTCCDRVLFFLIITEFNKLKETTIWGDDFSLLNSGFWDKKWKQTLTFVDLLIWLFLPTHDSSWCSAALLFLAVSFLQINRTTDEQDEISDLYTERVKSILRTDPRLWLRHRLDSNCASCSDFHCRTVQYKL